MLNDVQVMRKGLGSLPLIVNLVTLHIKIKKQHTERETLWK